MSYARDDLQVVRPLVELLKRDGFTVWFDPDDRIPGKGVKKQIADAINASDYTIAFLSDSHLSSPWGQDELESSVYRDTARKTQNTIPVMIHPVSQEIPSYLEKYNICDLTNHANFTQVYEQITRSIRPAGEPEHLTLDRESVERFCDGVLQHVEDPYVALFQIGRAAERLAIYLYRRDIGEVPPGAKVSELIDRLLMSGKLPPDIRASMAMVQTYGNVVAKDQVNGPDATPESIAPAFAALKSLVDWTFDRKPVDPWPDILASLPAGPDPGERQIPGADYCLREPKLSQNSLGPLYAGRDTQRNEPVSVNLVALTAGRDNTFFEDIERFTRLRDSHIVLPLNAGRVTVAGQDRCLYLIMPSIDAVSAQDLTRHFGTLPPRAAYELCLGIGRALNGFHEQLPAIVHGDIKPANVLVDSYGEVRVLCVGRDLGPTSTSPSPDGRNDSFLFSSPEQVSGATLTPHTDLFALYSVLFYSLSGEYPSPGTVEPPVPPAHLADSKGPLDQLWHCQTAAQACRVLEDACRGLPESTGLRSLNRRYRKETGRSVPQQQHSPVPTGGEFVLVAVFPVHSRMAWPLHEDRLLVWETSGDTLATFDGSDLIWRDEQPVRVRRVATGTGGRLAVGSWDGAVRYFADGELVAAVNLDGAVGDLRFTSDALVAGSWKHQLWRISADGSHEKLLGPDRGVHRIAVIDQGTRFAVADLFGGIAVYANYRKVLDVPALDQVDDIAYAGSRLMILTHEAFAGMGLNGFIGPTWARPGSIRLLPAPVAGCCLLLVQSGGDRGSSALEAWLIDEAQAQSREFTLPPGHALLTTCDEPKRFTLGLPDGGCAYWRDGAERWVWPDALYATVSADGRLIAVSRPGKVELYEDS